MTVRGCLESSILQCLYSWMAASKHPRPHPLQLRSEKPDLETEFVAHFSFVSCISTAVQYPPHIQKRSFVQTNGDKILGHTLGPPHYWVSVNAVTHNPLMIGCKCGCNIPPYTVGTRLQPLFPVWHDGTFCKAPLLCTLCKLVSDREEKNVARGGGVKAKMEERRIWLLSLRGPFKSKRADLSVS